MNAGALRQFPWIVLNKKAANFTEKYGKTFPFFLGDKMEKAKRPFKLLTLQPSTFQRLLIVAGKMGHPQPNDQLAI